MRALLLLALLVFGIMPLYAQPETQDLPQTATDVPAYRVEGLTTADGLSNNSVVSMAQDRQGFLWFGTWNGLNRYDGTSFKTFYHAPSDSTSLPDDWVESLLVDREGTLWVGGYRGGGLARFDPVTESFMRYSFREQPDDPTSADQELITAILEDQDGRLWVGTHGGLMRFDPATGAFTRFQHDPGDENSLSNDQVRALYLDRSGTLWVGTGSATPALRASCSAQARSFSAMFIWPRISVWKPSLLRASSGSLCPAR